MKVLHIIPSAFNYFDDIRAEAFELIESLHKLGVEAEAFTLQYGGVGSSKRYEGQVKEVAPSRHFAGTVRGEELVASFGEYDLIHVHCPFFGAARGILHWKELNPKIPLVATYHRAFVATDLFGWCIKWYSDYYLPKILSVADAVVYEPRDAANAVVKYVKDSRKLVELNSSANFLGVDLSGALSEFKLGTKELLALKYKMLYNEVTGGVS